MSAPSVIVDLAPLLDEGLVVKTKSKTSKKEGRFWPKPAVCQSRKRPFTRVDAQ
jgi:hypothetical protein